MLFGFFMYEKDEAVTSLPSVDGERGNPAQRI